jgi:flagellar assembly protein FliH
MAAPSRFLFDRDFAAPAASDLAAPTIELAVHQALLADAEARAFEAGRAAGSDTSSALSARRLADEAGRLASAAQSMLAVLDGERARVEREAVLLAEVIGTALARELTTRAPRAAILAAIDDCMGPLRRAPHLVVRLAVDEAEALRPAVQAIADERGFAGRLIVLGEDAVAPGDCRIEWADGGIVVDRKATETAVAAAVARHLASFASPVPPSPDLASPAEATP